jgi:hypothetical protein
MLCGLVGAFEGAGGHECEGIAHSVVGMRG